MKGFGAHYIIIDDYNPSMPKDNWNGWKAECLVCLALNCKEPRPADVLNKAFNNIPQILEDEKE